MITYVLDYTCNGAYRGAIAAGVSRAALVKRAKLFAKTCLLPKPYFTSPDKAGHQVAACSILSCTSRFRIRPIEWAGNRFTYAAAEQITAYLNAGEYGCREGCPQYTPPPDHEYIDDEMRAATLSQEEERNRLRDQLQRAGAIRVTTPESPTIAQMTDAIMSLNIKGLWMLTSDDETTLNIKFNGGVTINDFSRLLTIARHILLLPDNTLQLTW